MRNVMLQNSINLMVQPDFSPVNCPLSSAFANICQNLSFESLLSNASLVSKVSKQCFVFCHFWLLSRNNQPTLDWKFKNDWTKRLQKIPRKINLSLSLDKRKLAEKNECSGHRHACFDIPHKLPYLEHDFMITNLVRLGLIFWKYWRRPRDILVLC